MAILCIDGFEKEHNLSASGWGVQYHRDYGRIFVVSGGTGNYCVQQGNYTTLFRTLNSDSSVIVMGFAQKIFDRRYLYVLIRDQAGNSFTRGIELSLDPQQYCIVKDTGTYGSGQVIARFPYPFAANTQYYLQIKYIQHPINGELKIFVGNENVVDLTHRDFHSQYNIINYVAFNSSDRQTNNVMCHIDDIYILDGRPPLNDILGVCQVLATTAGDEGAQMDFEVYNAPDSTAAISELSANSDTYIWSATLDAVAMFKPTPLDVTGQILAITLNDYAARSASGSGYGKYKYVLKDTSNNTFIGNEFVLSSSAFTSHSQVFYNNPFTNESWTIGDVNNLEFGIKITQVE